MNKGITSTGKLKKGIIGAIIGDIVGSRFEWHNHRYTDFELVHKDCLFTDDTVMTIAIADWLIAKTCSTQINIFMILQAMIYHQ